MEIHRALDQISEIHEQLAKGEIYRGFRSVPVAASGLLALAAPVAADRFGVATSDWRLVAFWSVVAALGMLLSSSGIASNYALRNTERERRLTRRVAGQMIPCLFSGVLVAAAFLAAGAPLTYLPGLWAILFGLGVFSARPYLPRMVGWVALGYLVAGFHLLLLGWRRPDLLSWGMGLTFGVGQLVSALVLYWNLERNNHHV